MARLIPNENVWVGFLPAVANLASPSTAEITAGKNLTGYLISFNASTNGNTVPTPTLDNLFETSVPGTVSATVTADFYRDDTVGVTGDLAWVTLPRKTKGFFVLSRFGTGGTAPVTGTKVEVWPITVVSRTMANMSNNSVMTFTVTCAVSQVPVEAATVA